MKHVTNQNLFQYWMRQRGRRALPMRRDIEPADIHLMLPDTFVLQCDEPGGYGFRIAGTRICAFYGRELKGTGFLWLWEGADREALRASLAEMRKSGHCTLIGWEAATQTGDAVKGESLLLPLGTDRQDVTRILGTLVPMQVPYWLGMLPVESLRMQSVRMIDPASRQNRPFGARAVPRGEALATAPRPVLTQGHLALYLGGRHADEASER